MRHNLRQVASTVIAKQHASSAWSLQRVAMLRKLWQQARLAAESEETELKSKADEDDENEDSPRRRWRRAGCTLAGVRVMRRNASQNISQLRTTVGELLENHRAQTRVMDTMKNLYGEGVTKAVSDLHDRTASILSSVATLKTHGDNLLESEEEDKTIRAEREALEANAIGQLLVDALIDSDGVFQDRLLCYLAALQEGSRALDGAKLSALEKEVECIVNDVATLGLDLQRHRELIGIGIEVLRHRMEQWSWFDSAEADKAKMQEPEHKVAGSSQLPVPEHELADSAPIPLPAHEVVDPSPILEPENKAAGSSPIPVVDPSPTLEPEHKATGPSPIPEPEHEVTESLPIQSPRYKELLDSSTPICQPVARDEQSLPDESHLPRPVADSLDSIEEVIPEPALSAGGMSPPRLLLTEVDAPASTTRGDLRGGYPYEKKVDTEQTASPLGSHVQVPSPTAGGSLPTPFTKRIVKAPKCRALLQAEAPRGFGVLEDLTFAPAASWSLKTADAAGARSKRGSQSIVSPSLLQLHRHKWTCHLDAMSVVGSSPPNSGASAKEHKRAVLEELHEEVAPAESMELRADIGQDLVSEGGEEMDPTRCVTLAAVGAFPAMAAHCVPRASRSPTRKGSAPLVPRLLLAEGSPRKSSSHTLKSPSLRFIRKEEGLCLPIASSRSIDRAA